jgi:hypothetical protein
MNKNFFKNKSLLITGGTGSFGKALVNYFLKNKFHKSFGTGLKASITDEKIEGAEVFAKDGSFLFSFEESPVTKSNFLPTISSIFYFLSLIFFLLLILLLDIYMISSNHLREKLFLPYSPLKLQNIMCFITYPTNSLSLMAFTLFRMSLMSSIGP